MGYRLAGGFNSAYSFWDSLDHSDEEPSQVSALTLFKDDLSQEILEKPTGPAYGRPGIPHLRHWLQLWRNAG